MGSVLLIRGGRSTLGLRGATIGEIGFLRGIWMDGARRLAWLEDYARLVHRQRRCRGPSRLTLGIDLSRVSFSYPGTERLSAGRHHAAHARRFGGRHRRGERRR